MERAEWLKQMRSKAEAFYDQVSPQYWVTAGLSEDETHQQFLQKFLKLVVPSGAILSAACGAGRYDGILLDAGHPVLGIDQSAGMLRRAKEHFPQIRYQKMALQEMHFREAFDGVICMDSMEHICPEDYPTILLRFQEALKPGGVLYFTADREEEPDFDLELYYAQAKALGLPVVFGEVAQEAIEQRLMENLEVPEEGAWPVYHYYPPLARVRTWINQAGLTIEAEGSGSGFHHFLLRKMERNAKFISHPNCEFAK
jgi:2-polyprenyl-3-methyl-5-hydroxy-6-metoxy-1,4-benzoquinol methylase